MMAPAVEAGKMDDWVALLRGVNVGGGNKVPMADLRALAVDLGWRDVRSHVASGNLVFRTAGEDAAPANTLRQARTRRWPRCCRRWRCGW